MKSLRRMLVAAFVIGALVAPSAAHAIISLDAGGLVQSSVTTGNGDLLGPTGFPVASLPALSTFTVTPTFKSTNVVGLGTLAPYVDMVKEPVFAFYRTTFALPVGFSAVSFTFQALFDNELQVFLNGTSIALDPTGLGPGCTGVGDGCRDFSAPNLPVSAFAMNASGVVSNPIPGDQAFPFVTINQSLFSSGLNELLFVLGNSGGGTGDLGFNAAIGFSEPIAQTPEPTTGVLVGLGVALFASRFRRRRKSR